MDPLLKMMGPVDDVTAFMERQNQELPGIAEKVQVNEGPMFEGVGTHFVVFRDPI